MTEFNLGNCGSCPKVLECLESAEATRKFTGRMAEEAMSPEFDEVFAPALFGMFDGEVVSGLRGPSGQPFDSPAELAAFLRKNVGNLADYIDKQSEEELSEAAQLVDGCEGPLKMRATKAGRQIVATICNSPGQSDGSSCEEVFIARQTKK